MRMSSALSWTAVPVFIGLLVLGASGCPSLFPTGDSPLAPVGGGDGTGGGGGGLNGSPGGELPAPRVRAGAAEPLPPSLRAGQETFRADTFGDEAFWSGTLKLHLAIEGAAHGGVGPGVSPKTALAVGLKVDSEALSAEAAAALRQGKLDLDAPETTLALLSMDAVVGLRATMTGDGRRLETLGIQCALCHSTVDDSVAPGIGKRLDGWANRDLNVGAIVDLSPDLSALSNVLGLEQDDVRTVLRAWGPGRFDAQLLLDGKATRPDGKTAAVLIPPAFGLLGVNLHTSTGWGSVPYWNAFVAVLEMHGRGNFFDPRLDDATLFPVAARNRFGHVRVETKQDRVSPKLAGLQAYQLSLAPPPPPAGSFDPAAASRGGELFRGQARCASCHVPPLFTEPGWNVHPADELGIDDFQASRSPTGAYRTTPLRGLWTHLKGGLYHDGRFATLMDVVNHYDEVQGLRLSGADKLDLVEYLKSL